MFDSLRTHEPQHTRPPCPSPTPGVHLNPCPLSRWCHPTISFSVIPFSCCPQSFPASGSFPMSQLFASGSQRIGASVSASVPPIDIWAWFPFGLTHLVSLKSKELSRFFSSTTVRKHQFFLVLGWLAFYHWVWIKIKRCLLIGEKCITNINSILKSRDVILPAKVPLVKVWFFQLSYMDVRVGL